MSQVINEYFLKYIPQLLGIPVTVITSLPKKKECETSLARLLSKVVDNKFLLCKIDTLRYELKDCPATNQSMREEYNKCFENSDLLLELKQKRAKVYFMNEKTRSFGMSKKPSNFQK